METQEIVQTALLIAQSIRKEVAKHTLPPEEGAICSTEVVLPISLFKRTRGYIERVVHQINLSYEHGCYDACSVMIRRLLETLIIEDFEHYAIDSKIKRENGDFLPLSDLITKTCTEDKWNLSRNTKQALPRLKNIGDLSAHNRRYNAHRNDIDSTIRDLRIVVQELIYLAELK
jgi:hypothetical protein